VPADPVSSTPVSTTPDVVVDANAAPTIAAAPALTVMAGSAYTLIPAAQDADGDTLAFSVTNRPKWATFSTVTGQLTGKPSAADVGTYNNVSISVSDGTTATSLPAFTVTVAAAAAPASTADGVTLEWTAPLAAVDNSQLTNLAGYRIHYGTSETALTNTIEVANPGVLSYVMQNLEPGTYYFAVRAFNDQGEVSDLSNVSSLSIT
jgi:hypothetical protein